LKFLMKNPYSTIYAVSKGCNIAYNQMHQIVRELVFCRLILSKDKEGENGEIYPHFFIPSKMIFCKKCGTYRGCWEFSEKYICCGCGSEIKKQEEEDD